MKSESKNQTIAPMATLLSHGKHWLLNISSDDIFMHA
jgi:hypothetical protein